MFARDLLDQNIAALDQARAFIRGFEPDLVLGVERGGGFLLDALGPDFPVLKVPKAGTDRNAGEVPAPPSVSTIGGHRAPHLVAAIEAAIANGQYRFVVFDVYMGGIGLREIRSEVFDKVMERASPEIRGKLRFESIWLREQHGFERLDLVPEAQKLLLYLNLADHPGPIMAQLRAAAAESEEAFRSAVLDVALRTVRDDLARDDVPLALKLARSENWATLTDPETLATLRRILQADPEAKAHLIGGGLEPRRAFEAEHLVEGVNIEERIIPVRLAAGDDMKMVLEPGTSSDPIVVVDVATGQWHALPLGILDPVTGEPLTSQRAIVAALLQGHFRLDWE
jgi:hypothetical protein